MWDGKDEKAICFDVFLFPRSSLNYSLVYFFKSRYEEKYIVHLLGTEWCHLKTVFICFFKKNYTANACKAWCFFRLGATHGPGLKFHWFTLMHSLLHLQLLLYHGQGCSRSRAYPGNTGWEYNLYGIQVKLDVMKLWNFTVIQAQVQIRDPWLSCQVALPTCCPIHINRWDVFHQWYLNTLICLSHIAMKNNGNKTYWTVRT